jgi:sterol desaturase/sphingolipid hydroxylase (fatty acid hydroxylase superfamily)
MTFVASAVTLSALYLTVAGLERMPALRFRKLTSPRPYLRTDAAWYGVAIAATAISVFLFRPQLAKLAIAPLADAIASSPLAAQLILGVIVFDFVSFAVHVGMHRSDRLWNIHKVHHSSLELDGFATTRAHMLENLVRFVPAQAALFVLGFPVSLVTPTVAIVAAFGISNHSNLGADLGWAEAIIVTPRLHRRHHVPATTLHNYGTVLTIWDRAFGTLSRLDTRPDERYGVPREIDTYPQHFAEAFRHPFVQTRSQRRAENTRRAELATGEPRPPRADADRVTASM